MRCTHCKKECSPKVYSAGDYDPFCSQECHDLYFKELSEEMGRINQMSDRQFHSYMLGTNDGNENTT